MFLDRGFDAVRVSEVAEACGVSEKTVFNYFPTKESLVLDRLEATMASLQADLPDPAVPPVEAALWILDRELEGLTTWLTAQDNPDQAARAIRRFGDLIRATPSLRAYQSDMMDRLVSAAAEILAARAGMNADDPEPQIAARALLGLWHVQGESLRKHLGDAPAQVHEKVTADVRRAAGLIIAGCGLRSAYLSAKAPPLLFTGAARLEPSNGALEMMSRYSSCGSVQGWPRSPSRSSPAYRLQDLP